MMRLNTGDIALVQVNNFTAWYRVLLAKLIQWFDRTYYHHAVLYCDGVFHEADTTVLERPLSYYNGDRLYILLLFQFIYRLSGIWIGRRGKKSEQRPFCSEHTLTPIHYVRGYFQDKYKWSPGDIARKGAAYYRVKWEGVFNDKEWL